MSKQKTLVDIQKDFQETLAQFDAKCQEFDRLMAEANRLLNKLEKDEY